MSPSAGNLEQAIYLLKKAIIIEAYPFMAENLWISDTLNFCMF